MKISKYLKLHGTIIASKILVLIVCFNFVIKYYKQNQKLITKIEQLEQNFSQMEAKKNTSSSIKAMIKKLRPNLDEDVIDNYSYLINKYCKSMLTTHMIAIIEQESGYNSSARNNDDWGLGQINARTWQKFFEVKNKEDLFNPVLNIRYSCKILELAYNTHYKRHGDNYVGFYHSWTPIHRKEYLKRLNKIKIKLHNEKM